MNTNKLPNELLMSYQPDIQVKNEQRTVIYTLLVLLHQGSPESRKERTALCFPIPFSQRAIEEPEQENHFPFYQGAIFQRENGTCALKISLKNINLKYLYYFKIHKF